MENTLKIKVFRNDPSLKVLEARTGEICRMHWKLRIKKTPVLFCKYLRNESSNLHEIVCGGQSLSCELKFQIL